MSRFAALAAALLLTLHPGSAHASGPAAAQGEVAIQGGRLRFSSFGSGRPVLVLAGGPGFSGAYMAPVARRLGERAWAILPDPRGTGGSRLGREDESTLTLAAYVADLEALRIHLKVDRWTLVGSSFGGTWALAYAARHPERVQSLVLADPGGMSFQGGWVQQFLANLQARMTPEDREAVAYWSSPEVQAANPRRAATEAFRAKAPSYMAHRRNVHRFLATIHMDDFNPVPGSFLTPEMLDPAFDLAPRLRGLTLPTLVITGRESPIPESVADDIVRTLPGARKVVVPDCGHWLWLEQPAAFHSEVEAFLEAAHPRSATSK